MYAHAVAQIEGTLSGIHLLWMGPYPWAYSLEGWTIQRRLARPSRTEFKCESLDLGVLRVEREARLTFGAVTLRDGRWPEPIGVPKRGSSACDVLTLELDVPAPAIRADVTAGAVFAVALRDGKAVTTAGPSASGSFRLSAPSIDAVLVYAMKPTAATFCVSGVADRDEKEWARVPTIVRGLQMPIRELMSGLVDEYAEAKSRLLDGEGLDVEELDRFTALARVVATSAGPPRPIDLALLIREGDEGFQELTAVDPMHVLATDPKWRRILGFGWFDDDRALVAGQRYDYRITGRFPAEDLADRIYGFHMLPSETPLPADLFLEDLRVRLARPGRVERFAEPHGAGRVFASRRGVRLEKRDEPWWVLASLDDWELVADFPAPVGSVVLELAEGHELEFAAGMAAGAFSGVAPVPAGARPRLDFPVPIEQLRLRGTGFLHALRVPAGPTGLVPVSVVVSGVLFENTPRPKPPLFAAAENLQRPVGATLAGPNGVAHRHELGFDVQWRPAPSAALAVWPADAGAAPPLDETAFQVEHREVDVDASGVVASATVWHAVLPGENRMLGTRDAATRDTSIRNGVDLASRFPEILHKSSTGSLDVGWRDVFDPAAGANEMRGDVPKPGTWHQYRVRSVDVIGRGSLSEAVSPPVRLEKHVPPPVPVGSVEGDPVRGAVRARVLVRDAPDLTGEDVETLGTSENAIVLEWGWHDTQRRQDPYASEFRVYASDGPLDRVRGVVVGVAAPETGRYDLTVELERAIAADAARGLTLDAGYPFFIAGNTAGTTVVLAVEAHVPSSGGELLVAPSGPVFVPLPMTSELARPAAWPHRVATPPITDERAYRLVLRDRLTLTPGNPFDAIWVGVTSADGEIYVHDTFPNGGRLGNESGVAAVLCEARYHGRPAFDVPATIAPVAEIVTPEPVSGGAFTLDLAPHIAEAGLSAHVMVRPERIAVDAVYAAYEASDDHVVARIVGRHDIADAPAEITVPDPTDRGRILSALLARECGALDDRDAVFLAQAHPYRDRLFEAATVDPVPNGPFTTAVPQNPGRYVFRIRLADAAGHLSAGGCVARVIVRVPSPSRPPAPERGDRRETDAPGTLRLRVAPEADLTHLLTFALKAAGPTPTVELVRAANRPDLAPHARIRVRSTDGVLRPASVTSLADPAVEIDPDGFRTVPIAIGAPPGSNVRVWAYTLTRDAVASEAGGPWTIAMPPPRLPVPALAVGQDGSRLLFSWTWPPAGAATVALERSADGGVWERVSPPVDQRRSSLSHDPEPGAWLYRLAVSSPDGRIASSNVVTS